MDYNVLLSPMAARPACFAEVLNGKAVLRQPLSSNPGGNFWCKYPGRAPKCEPGRAQSLPPRGGRDIIVLLLDPVIYVPALEA